MEIESRKELLILVLIGIPACGKSYFAFELEKRFGRGGTKVKRFSFDEFHLNLGGKEGDFFDPEVWKKSRENAIHEVKDCVSSFLNRKENGEEKMLVVIDDNNYYKSMRREYYKLARESNLFQENSIFKNFIYKKKRKGECGFLQVFVNTDLEKCLSRNEKRDLNSRVAEKAIRQMKEKMQVPIPQASNSKSWDKCLELREGEQVDWEEILSTAFSNPLLRVDEDERMRQSELQRKINQESFFHNLELSLRKLISNKMKTLKDKAAAKQFSSLKASFMEEKKRDYLSRVCMDFEALLSNFDCRLEELTNSSSK